MRRLVVFTTMIIMTLIIAACSSGEAENENAVAKDVVSNPDEERYIRDISILSRPQSAAPDEYETAVLIQDALQELGVNAEVETKPWEQISDEVWFAREDWDITGWQMTARPERLDPDEFTYNLFHSSGVEDGYNFMGYESEEYDELATAQRKEIDQDKRAELVKEAQQMIADDAVYHFTVHPMINTVYNTEVFKSDSIVDMAGLGARNFWTYVEAEPAGDVKDIILNSPDTVQSINPFYISGAVDSWITELIWDRLMRVDEEGLPELWAAEEVDWVDDTTVNVKIRENMKWHDGNPVTAEDVKFSFEAPMTGEAPMYEAFVDIIDNITIENDYELTFKLHEPWSAFETATLAKLNIVPKHIWEPILEDLEDKPENLESHQEEVPVGSGPYAFAHWKSQEEVVLNAYEEHFAAPNMERWIMRVVPNMEATLGMMQNGELNFLAAYTGDGDLLTQSVEEHSHLEMISSVDLGFRFFAVNHRLEPFDDLAFRKALQAVIDKDRIVQTVWKGHAEPADSVIAPTLEFWKNEDIETPSGGVNEAIEILKEAGYQWDEEGLLLKPE